MDHRSLRPALRHIRALASAEHAGEHDQQLLDTFQQRQDEAAFAALVARHGPLVLGVCRRVLGNDHDAEDVFQSTFLVLARRAGSIRQRESLGSWLYKVAYRLALRLRARAVPLPVAEVPAEASPASGPDDISWRELRTILDAELQQLPEKYRAPLVLCYLAGKTRDEVAEELGWTVGAVKGRLERGRDLLRSRLERRGLTLSAALVASALAATQASGAVPARLVEATAHAAASFAGGVTTGLPATALSLAGQELASSMAGRVKLLTALAGLLGAVVLGVGVALAPSGVESPIDAAAAEPDAPAAVGHFVDITRASGLEAIVADKYAVSPKWWLSGLHFVDLDGDGKLDFFMSAHGGGGALAALNDGKGNFKLASGNYPTTEIHLAYDANEDGLVDLTMTYQDGGGQWWLNESKPGMLNFTPAIKTQRGTNTARRQAIIDINRDGKADWLRGTPQSIFFEHGDGKGGFSDGGRLATTNQSRAECLCLPVDLDGDGFIDLVVEWGHYDFTVGISRLFRNDGKGGFTDVTRESGLPLEKLSIKGVADLNNDGFPDLIVLEDKKPELYLNDGKGKFTKKPNAFVGMEKATRAGMASWGLAVVTDFDNDGIPDILWNGKNFLWVLRGQGDGTFRYMNAEWRIKDLATSSIDDGLCFGDIDGDGMLDIAGYTALGEQRRVALYHNELPRQNWLNIRPIGKPGNRGAAGAKVRLLEPGTGKLLRYEQVAIFDSQAAASYYAYAETERHYGLGQRERVDVSIEFYPSGKTVLRRDVPANGTVRITED